MPKEYLDKLRSKYPQYADMNDSALAAKYLAKYPQYQDVLGDLVQPQSPPFLQQIVQGVTSPGRMVEQAGESMQKDIPLGVAQAGSAGLQGGMELTGVPSIIRGIKQAGKVGEFVGGGLEGVMNTVPAVIRGGSNLIGAGLRAAGVPENVLNMGMSSEASKAGSDLLINAGSIPIANEIQSSAVTNVPPFIEKKFGETAQLAKSAAEIKRVAPPTGKELHYDEALSRANPYIADQYRKTPIDQKSDLSPVRQSATIVHDAMDNLWKDKVVPQIQRHADLSIDGTKVATEIKDNIGNYTQDLDPVAASSMKDFANLLNKPIPIEKAQEYLSGLNADLSKYYKMTPGEQAIADKTNGGIAAKQIAAEAMRNEIYDKLESSGESLVPALRKDYGALKQVHTALERNIVRTEKPQLPWYSAGWRHSGSPVGAAFVGEIAAHALGADPVTTAVAAVGSAGAIAYAKHRALPQPMISRAFKRLGESSLNPREVGLPSETNPPSSPDATTSPGFPPTSTNPPSAPIPSFVPSGPTTAHPTEIPVDFLKGYKFSDEEIAYSKKWTDAHNGQGVVGAAMSDFKKANGRDATQAEIKPLIDANKADYEAGKPQPKDVPPPAAKAKGKAEGGGKLSLMERNLIRQWYPGDVQRLLS